MNTCKLLPQVPCTTCHCAGVHHSSCCQSLKKLQLPLPICVTAPTIACIKDGRAKFRQFQRTLPNIDAAKGISGIRLHPCLRWNPSLKHVRPPHPSGMRFKISTLPSLTNSHVSSVQPSHGFHQQPSPGFWPRRERLPCSWCRQSCHRTVGKQVEATS